MGNVPPNSPPKITVDGYREMGNKYFNGEGHPKDYTRAFQCYLQAAKMGDSACQNYVGFMYYKGLGITQDYKESFSWYLKSAELGYLKAIFNVGHMYLSGIGVEKDYEKALDWLSKAAELGDSFAQNGLALMFQNGLGIEKDYSLAHKWYLKSAAQGNGGAELALGYLYHHGLGVEKNMETALKWYKSAAEKGIPKAFLRLGEYYEEMQDMVQSALWYERAALKGEQEASVKRKTVLASLNTAEFIKEIDAHASSREINDCEKPETETPIVSENPIYTKNWEFDSEFLGAEEWEKHCKGVYKTIEVMNTKHIYHPVVAQYVNELFENYFGNNGKYQLVGVKAIDNFTTRSTFQFRRDLMSQRLESDAETFAIKQYSADDEAVRKYLDKFFSQADRFKHNFGKQVKAIPVLHAIKSLTESVSLCEGRMVESSAMEDGMLGKGIYFTTSIQYAMTRPGDIDKEGSKNLLLCWILIANPYPCLKKELLVGKPLIAPHDSHIGSLVKSTKEPIQVEQFVIDQEAQILPRFVLSIKEQ